VMAVPSASVTVMGSRPSVKVDPPTTTSLGAGLGEIGGAEETLPGPVPPAEEVG
jgi:hypothetical protein